MISSHSIVTANSHQQEMRRRVLIPHPFGMQERFLVEQQGLPGFFHVVARYGYNERVVQDANFVQARHLTNHLPWVRLQQCRRLVNEAADRTAAVRRKHNASALPHSNMNHLALYTVPIAGAEAT